MALNVESSGREDEREHQRFSVRFALMLLALLWASCLVGLVGLMGSNAQSQVAIHFHTTQIAWFSVIGSLCGTFSTPFVMKLAGFYGKKRVLLVITMLGLVGDLIAALSPTYSMLLVGRAIAGFYVPSIGLCFALTRDVFPRRLVGPASGFLASGLGFLSLGGTFLAGWVLDDFGYKGILWAMAASTALSLVLVHFIVPESPVREERTPLDWIGGTLLGGGFTAFVYGVGQGASWGWTSGRTLLFLIGGVLAVVAFGLYERRAAHPLVPLQLLARRRVWSTFLVTALVSAAVYSQGTVQYLLVLMPHIPHLSDGLGWSATKNAWVGAPASVIVITVAVATGVLARRLDTRIILGVGTALVATSYAIMSQFHYSVAEIMTLSVFGGIGMGLVVAVIPIMIIESVSPQEQAMGNGSQSMTEGVVESVLTQIAFVVVAQGDHVMRGTAFYSDKGYTSGFLMFAGIIAVAALLTFLIPKARNLNEVELGQGA